jgi:hypothetical protein
LSLGSGKKILLCRGERPASCLFHTVDLSHVSYCASVTCFILCICHMFRTVHLSHGIQRPGCEINHLPPPSTEIRNEWSYTSTFSIFHHGVRRDNFFFFTYRLLLVFEPRISKFLVTRKMATKIQLLIGNVPRKGNISDLLWFVRMY